MEVQRFWRRQSGPSGVAQGRSSEESWACSCPLPFQAELRPFPQEAPGEVDKTLSAGKISPGGCGGARGGRERGAWGLRPADKGPGASVARALYRGRACRLPEVATRQADGWPRGPWGPGVPEGTGWGSAVIL